MHYSLEMLRSLVGKTFSEVAGIELYAIMQRIAHMCLTIIGAFVLSCIHNICTTILFARSFFYNVSSVIISSCQVRDTCKHNFDCFGRIREEVKSLRKVPLHLAVVLGFELVSYTDLNKLISWCLPAGVAYISFYKHNDALNPKQLYRAVCEDSKESLQRIKWGESFSEDIRLSARRDRNGYKWSPQLEVNIYRTEDGREGIVRAAVEMCHDLSPSTLQTRLCVIPDPDLTIVCGWVPSSYGFLPWHLRLTQFLLWRTHHKVTVDEFLRTLRKYGKCEHRFGK